jgi:hypothetical protein
MSATEDTQMPRRGNEYLLDTEELKTLNAAEALLREMAIVNPDTEGNFPFQAWNALWKVLHPAPRSEDEVEMARRMA